MGEPGEESDQEEPSYLQRNWTTPVLIFLAALLFTLTTVVYASLRFQAFSSSSPSSPSSISTVSNSGRPFFIFGDSYADVGNLPFGPARNSPYGVTWPGHPYGRFSDGYVLSDSLAKQVLGRPSPSPFAKSDARSLFDGVNFAVGGAGVTYAYGAPTISAQVGWFEAIVNTGIYTTSFLESSVTLLCVAGNDYGAYRGPIENYVAFTEEVVGLIGQSLRKLHSLGLRNIMVTTLAPLDCLPESTSLTNYTACSANSTVEDVMFRHNSYLEAALVALSKDLSGVNFLLLRLGDALKHVQTNGSFFNISEPLKPCCLGFCGVVDLLGHLLYTVCANPENYAVWDGVHPTQAAWENVVNLYINDQAFTTFAPTLQQWAQKL